MSYGRLKEPKLKEKDYVLSCQQTRQELSDYIDQQARRVNVDSAKKRAVLQHMDYEGFRQMVLGANIFPTKSTQLYNFSKGQSSQISANKQFDERKLQTNDKDVSYEKSVQGKSQMHCNSFREFKKKFMGHFIKNEEQKNEQNNQNVLFCYNLVKEQNEERLRRIFNAECEGNILLKIVSIFQAILNELSLQQNEGLHNQAGFMLLFFRVISSIPTMSQMSLLILSKKEKQRLVDFILGLKKVINDASVDEQIERVSKVFAK